MAENHVERKRSQPWIWALMGIVAFVLATCVVAWWRNEPRGPLVGTAPGVVDPGLGAGGTITAADTGSRVSDTAAGTAGPVGDFLRYVEDTRARQAAGLSHESVADGLRRLAGAVQELSERNARGANVLAAELGALRAQADSLQRNPESTQHARYAREAFRTAASLMRALQQRDYPNVTSEVAQVRQAAAALRPEQLLLEQAPAVQRFFDRSAAALRAMVGASS